MGQSKANFKLIAEKLNLAPLEPEGGFFRRTYLVASNVEEPDRKPRTSAIYYLITGENFSSWHRVPQDEMFHFYAGSSVLMLNLSKNDGLSKVILGSDVLEGEIPQFVVPGGTWQALKLLEPEGLDDWALMGTTLTPGFDFEEFELGKREDLFREFPDYRNEIFELTRH